MMSGDGLLVRVPAHVDTSSLWGGWHWWRGTDARGFWPLLRIGQGLLMVEAVDGGLHVDRVERTGDRERRGDLAEPEERDEYRDGGDEVQQRGRGDDG